MGKYVEKDLHQCKKVGVFEMMDDYHYYNPSIYSMDVYFNGHNLRQMNRYAYIIWRLGYGYECLYKHRLLYGPDKNVDLMLEITRGLCVQANQVYEELSKWEAVSEFSRHSDKTFADYNSTSRMMPVDVREQREKTRKYLINLDEWGHKKKELVTIEDFEKHWHSFIDTFMDESRLFTSWGHWLTYLFEADLDGGEDTGLDLTNLDDLIQKGKKFDKQLIEFRFGPLKINKLRK